MLKDVSYQFSGQDIQDNKLMALLSYIGIFVIIPILVAKDSPFVRHNINQGLVLCLISVGLNVFGAFLMFVPFGSIFALVMNFAVWSVAITGVFHTAMGRAVKFPYIGDIEFIK